MQIKIKFFLSLLLAAILLTVFIVFFENIESNRISFENNQPNLETQVKKVYPESIPEMSKKEFIGTDLKLEKVLTKNSSYTRYYVTYKSEGLNISAIMNVPAGKGPFPILVLNHGYVEPQVYKNGTGGLQREQDFFARNGYVVFQSDYRGYAQSDSDPYNDVRPRTGYIEDVLNGISAMKNSDFSFLDKENIVMLGHSMGGGITTNIMVTKPDIAKAYVLLAPINSDYKINFDKWVTNDFSQTAELFFQRYGKYEDNPEFWESISAKNYLDKISQPVMIHQGSDDPDVPVQWSRDFANLLKEKNKSVTYYEYEGEKHLLYKSQQLYMDRTLEFLDKITK